MCEFGGLTPLTHFLPCEMLQRSRVVQELVLWCLLPAGGQLAWVCWQSGKIPAGHLPGVVPAWETPSVLPAWLPALLPPAWGWRSCRGCVTADSPACGSWGNVISCRDQEQLARNSSHLWSWNSNDRNKEALWEQKLQGLTLSVWGFKIILVCYRHCCVTAF